MIPEPEKLDALGTVQVREGIDGRTWSDWFPMKVLEVKDFVLVLGEDGKDEYQLADEWYIGYGIFVASDEAENSPAIWYQIKELMETP